MVTGRSKNISDVQQQISAAVEQAGERMASLASGLQDLLGGGVSNGNGTENDGANKNGKKKDKELSQV